MYRVQKLLSIIGYCSRRSAEELIRSSEEMQQAAQQMQQMMGQQQGGMEQEQPEEIQ